MEKLPEKTIFLMRHAKSDWADGASDEERPLNSRGKRDAKKMAQYLSGIVDGPVKIVASSAKRTRDTAAALIQAMPRAQLTIDETLYLAGVPTLYRVIEENLHEPYLILIAHNPGLEDLVNNLDPAVAERSRAHKLFPTGAIHAFSVSRVAKLGADSGHNDKDLEFRYLHHQRPKALT